MLIVHSPQLEEQRNSDINKHWHAIVTDTHNLKSNVTGYSLLVARAGPGPECRPLLTRYYVT